ncbi:MAG: nitroreductase family deazaflavin-dependent oxidoreductase [Actinomycetota bacterium]
MKYLLKFHQWLYETSGGRIGHGWLGRPVLLLRTTGARSGQRRTSALVYAEHDGVLAVVASAGGADRNPAWYHNLVKNPVVEVQRGTQVEGRRATTAEGDERAVWWQRCNEINDGRYDTYQSETSRHIPVVLLRNE